VKFTTFGDCLGFATPDPDDTGEYAMHGTLGITWLGPGGAKAGTSTAFVRTAITGASLQSTGVIIKGLGIGADVSATADFSPTHPSGDTNQNGQDDLIDCIVLSDPTAVGKVAHVVTPTSLDVDLPVTP
jgi:hypothetical protein